MASLTQWLEQLSREKRLKVRFTAREWMPQFDLISESMGWNDDGIKLGRNIDAEAALKKKWWV